MLIERSVEIECPIDEVYAYVANSGNDPAWCRNVKESQLVEGTPGEPGARYRQVQGPSPSGRDLDVRLVEVRPPEHVQLQARGSGVTFDVTYELVKTPTGTELTQRSHVRFEGPRHLARPLVRLVYPMTIRQQFGDLRELLERES